MSTHLASIDAAVLVHLAIYAGGALATLLLLSLFTGVHFIPNNRVGIVEKLWSLRGQVREGRLMVLDGETGYQASVLRGGIYFFFWRWPTRSVTRSHKLRPGRPSGSSRPSTPSTCRAALPTPFRIARIAFEAIAWP
jgi:hypothetical protein